MTNDPFHKLIEVELEEFLSKSSHTWLEIAEVLFSVERTGTWSEETGSFSQWIIWFSKRLSVSETTLWRYKSSYSTLLRLKTNLIAHGSKPTDIDSQALRANAEQLEIYERLTRVMKDEDALNLGQRILQRSVSRDELRTLWKIYSPLLSGKTSRGRSATRLKLEDQSVRLSSDIKATVASALYKSKNWLNQKSNTTKTYSDVKVITSGLKQAQIDFDAVVVAMSDESKTPLAHPIEIHAIEILDTPHTPASLAKIYEAKSAYSHFFWFAVDMRSSAYAGYGEAVSEVGAGLLWCVDGQVILATPAKPTAGKRVGDTALTILEKTLRR